MRSFANELGQLAQGIRNIQGTNTIVFIPKSEVPANKRCTYGKINCDIKPEKEETHRSRLTVGGNNLPFDGPLSTPTATVTTAKCLFNSVISTTNAKCLTADIKHFYLNNVLPDPEYMKLPISIIPEEIIQAYNLRALVCADGFVHMRIEKGMYGLKQAGIIAHKELVKHMSTFGYHPVRFTPGLWKHETRPTIFSLVVDDFAVQYTSKEDADHLLSALRAKYKITVDMEAKLYIGISLEWDYINHTVTLSMPDYVRKALHKFQHMLPTKPEYAPHAHVPPNYGQRVQYAEPDDTSDRLSDKDTNIIQQVCGTFLYYGIALDNTILVALSDISSEQSRATKQTAKAVAKLLNYLATNPDAKIQYRASGMQLCVHSDGSYLSVSKARSRAGGIHFLSEGPPNPNESEDYAPPINGVLHVVCKIMKNIMASAAEVEYGTIFINGQEAVPIRTTLQEMSWPQGPTPIQADNSTAVGIANNTIKQKKSKAMDMRFYWINDRIKQGQFHVYWAPGPLNLGDYPSKHHAPEHHIKMRPTYLHVDSKKSAPQQGCVNMTVIPTAKPTTVITTGELSTVKDTVTRARLRADFYRYILSSQCDHKLTAT